MVNGNCAVVGCTNSRYQLRLWGEKICEEHLEMKKKDCSCSPPFRLYSFPSVKRNSDKRKEWIRLLKRTTHKNTSWTPGQSDMVCSLHFVDGEPSFMNPNPTLSLGYEKPAKKPRRKLCRQELPVASKATTAKVPVACDHDHEYCRKRESCQACIDKNTVIFSMANEITKLSKEKEKLQEDIDQLCEDVSELKLKQNIRKPFSAASIKSDSKMRFYTGIQSIDVFEALFSLVKPHAPILTFWRGRKVISSAVKKNRRYKSNKLCYRDQFLLVLLRLV